MEDCSYCNVKIHDGRESVGSYHAKCWLHYELDADARINVLAHGEMVIGSRMARRADQSDNPLRYLRDVIADPGHMLEDRLEASRLLQLDPEDAVSSEVRCPDCLEGEAFDMDQETGAVECANCGRGMDRPERFTLENEA